MLLRSIGSILPQVDRALLVLSIDFDAPDFRAVFGGQADKIEILRVPENQGSGTRFHCLDRIPPESDSFIVTLDDDLVVDYDYVAQMRMLLEQWNRLPIIGLHASFLNVKEGKTYRHAKSTGFFNSTSLAAEFDLMEEKGVARSTIHFSRKVNEPYVVDTIGTGIMMFHRSIAKDLSHKLFTRKSLRNMSDPWMAVYAKERCIPLITPPRRGFLARQQNEPEDGDNKSIFAQLKRDDSKQSRLITSTKGWFSTMGVRHYMRSPAEYIEWCTNMKKRDPSKQSRMSFLQ